MKGIVFTEFLDMVEERFGLEVVDHILTVSQLESQGIYTSVGTYSFAEMQELLMQLKHVSGIPVPDLIYEFGNYFFDSLTQYHPDILSSYDGPIPLLASIESHIHREVKKIYPNAELPTFEVVTYAEDYLEMIYTSDRGMYMFALALMQKTFEHFKGHAQIDHEKLKKDGTKVRFMIKAHDRKGKN